MIIYVENTYANNTKNLRKHLKSICANFGPVKKLGQRRFQALRAAWNPTLEELKLLCEILVSASKRYLHIKIIL